MPEASTDELIKAITEAGSNRSACIAHRLVDGVLWMVWERTFDRTERYVEFAQFKTDDSGTSYLWDHQSAAPPELPACPQELVERAR